MIQNLQDRKIHFQLGRNQSQKSDHDQFSNQLENHLNMLQRSRNAWCCQKVEDQQQVIIGKTRSNNFMKKIQNPKRKLVYTKPEVFNQVIQSKLQQVEINYEQDQNLKNIFEPLYIQEKRRKQAYQNVMRKKMKQKYCRGQNSLRYL